MTAFSSRARGPRGAARALAAAAALCLACGAASATTAGDEPVAWEVFRNDPIQFAEEVPSATPAGNVAAQDGGRVVVRTVNLEPPKGCTRIVARVVTRPVSPSELV